MIITRKAHVSTRVRQKQKQQQQQQTFFFRLFLLSLPSLLFQRAAVTRYSRDKLSNWSGDWINRGDRRAERSETAMAYGEQQRNEE